MSRIVESLYRISGIELHEDTYKKFKRKTFDPIKYLKDKFNVDNPYRSSFNELRTEDGENFILVIHFPSKKEVENAYNSILQDLRDLGAKKISKYGGWQTAEGGIKFTWPIKMQQQVGRSFDKEQELAELAYKDSINIDISKYKPNNKVMEKLQGYMDRGSKINVRAIKSIEKVLTYYYATILLGWKEMQHDLWYHAFHELKVDENILNTIAEKAE